jgi:midasin
LQDVITELQQIECTPSLKTLENILNTLSNILKHSETLNTGGHFEWVDSKIVKAIKFGHLICLEHVNLCSSAILDRLNPVFEPRGTLLISEKGVDSSNESELIQKHQNFRAFLTMDPKNGEISRAMRNRCIEIAFHKEAYTDDDLKKIIFENGVHHMFLIDAILRIHHAAKTISEFNTFGISNILKMTFLVAQNQRTGMDFKKSLSMSAMEVYVRSSNVDLLGHGIDYYRKMLKNVINDQIGATTRVEDVVNYECFILNSSELTSFKLVRLQCEPLLVSLKCFSSGHLNATTVLSSVSPKFEQINLNEGVLKFMLYMIYELASIADVEIRRLYLKGKLAELRLNGNMMNGHTTEEELESVRISHFLCNLII